MGIIIDYSIRAKYYTAVKYEKKFIVLHYTANSGTTATAKGNANYFANCDRVASAHFVVDEGQTVYCCVPSDYLAHAVGGTIYPATKGAAYYGVCGNANSISIEMVSHTDANGIYYIPDKTVDNALELVRQLQKEYGIDNDHVIRHYDVNGKPCPWCWTDVQGYDGERYWEAFLARLGGSNVVDDKNTVEPISDAPSVLYRVQTGAFSRREYAELMLEKIKKKGYDPFIVLNNGYYKVQVGAFSMRANADKFLEELDNKDIEGFIAISSPEDTKKTNLVKVTADVLNIRQEATVDSKVVGAITRNGVFTIVEEKEGNGATMWGKLKSGAGWISLDYVVAI